MLEGEVSSCSGDSNSSVHVMNYCLETKGVPDRYYLIICFCEKKCGVKHLNCAVLSFLKLLGIFNRFILLFVRGLSGHPQVRDNQPASQNSKADERQDVEELTR